MFRFDRTKFYAGVRNNITLLGQWNSLQKKYVLYPTVVNGLSDLLLRMEADSRFECIPQMAYTFATSGHETGREFRPIKEILAKRFTKLWFNQQRYSPYYGRGHVQLTWKDNYRAEGERLGVGNLFVRNPDEVLKAGYSYEILVGGMFLGRFRKGHSLTRYIDCGQKKDYYNCRNVVNGGLDRAGTIARLAVTFETILLDSKMKG